MSDIEQSAGPVPYQEPAGAPPPAPVATSALTDAGGGGGLLGVIERLATNPQLNVEVLDRLLAARRSEEDRAAERAFYAALALAKGEFAPIIKTRLVDFQHKDGRGRTSYKYEELADIAAIVDPVLSRNGLSYFHRSEQSQGKVRVFCTLAHADGFTKTNFLDGVEDTSGQKNANQMVTSTATFLQRATLKQALGIAAGRDDDNRSLGASPRISESQAAELKQLIDQTGRSQANLLKYFRADEIADLTVEQWTQAKDILAQAEKRNAPAGN